jgi:flagellar biosynthesis protein FlhG
VKTPKPSIADKVDTRIISVGGGKGGVGKSIVATNLAVALAQAGHEVVLCDLDLGAANLHLMLGLSRAKPGIAALLATDGSSLEEALTDTGIPRLKLLAGTGVTVAAANITHTQKLRIIRKLRGLRTDFVVVDVGAGVGYNALDFFELGQQRIVVATPQVTSMHDAYAFLKGAVLRTLRHHAARSPHADLLEPALASKEGEKVKDLLLRIRAEDDAFGDKVELILKRFGAYLVGNQVDDPSRVGVLQAVSRMVEDYLGISLPILGWIPSNVHVAESVNERRPYMARFTQGDSKEMRAFRSIVDALRAGDVAPEEELLLELAEDETAEAAPLSPLPVLDPSFADVTLKALARAALSPPPPPLEALAPRRPPPKPPAATDADLPVAVKPRIYERPPKKRKAEAEDKKRKRALDSVGRRRKLTLPGMPPSRSRP